MYEMNDNAAAIAAIQQLLRDAGYDIKPDGIYGEETYSAVRQFQSENSIPPTGRVDLATFEALAIAARPKPTYRCALIIPQILESGVISPGDKSSVVTIIQAMLKTLEIIYEYDSIDLAGVYDQSTEAAVRDIQRINSLPITGIIDAPTWNTLVSEYQKYSDSE